MVRFKGFLASFVLIGLVACGSQSGDIAPPTSYTVSGIENFMPGADVVHEEEDLADEPMFDNLEQALNAYEGLQTQGEESPQVTVYTHTFSNGETYTYTAAEGVVFEDDVILFTVKELRQAFEEYEQLLKDKAAGTLSVQGAAGTAYCTETFYFGQYVERCISAIGEKWPNSTIWIDTNSLKKFTPSQQQKIKGDFANVANRTDLKVKYRTSGIRVILYNPDRGCSATLGYSSKSNRVMRLANGCFGRQPKHELLHIAGHTHEQQRSDRNTYITVYDSNLTANGVNAFKKKQHDYETPLYDLASIMHYQLSVNRDTGFVKNTSIGAFKVKIKYSGVVGGNDLTARDIETVNRRY